MSCIFLSMKQNLVALPMLEAEYIDSRYFCAQLLWTKQTLEENLLTTLRKNAHVLWYTNAISLSEKPVQHSRANNIELRQLFIGDHIQQGDITFDFVRTNDQLTGIFTKPLKEDPFYTLGEN